MQAGDLLFVSVSINVAKTPWWFVDNRELEDDCMYWIRRNDPFVLLQDIRIGGDEIWKILTPVGVAYVTKDAVIRYAKFP